MDLFKWWGLPLSGHGHSTPTSAKAASAHSERPEADLARLPFLKPPTSKVVEVVTLPRRSTQKGEKHKAEGKDHTQ